MKKLGKNAGVTMAELLIVVAIIVALGGVATIAVWNYQRSLGQLERDGIAKEIFVAAQNHLTTAYGEGYLGLAESGYGTEETEEIETGVSKGTGVFYYIVNGGSASASVFDQMLPFGAIDETVRAGGSYIIRYQPDAAKVLDVFYCTKHGSPDQFNHDLKSSEYEEVLGLKDTADENHKSDRRNWNTHILGWYGGEEAAGTSKLEVPLERPTIEVINKERLYVIVTDNNTKNSGEYSLKLIITGETSGAQKGFVLLKSKKSSETIEPANGRVYSTSSSFEVTLDNIQQSGLHFAQIESDSGFFIPGENITVQAVAYSTEKLANVAYSNKVTTNSLFADGTTTGIAYIDNIRHLENLDKNISDFKDSTKDPSGKVGISKAVQRNELDWINDDENYWSGTITPIKGDPLSAGNYYPIEPDYLLEYDGQNHSISNIKATGIENAGLFGSVTGSTDLKIKDLELIDFTISGTKSAGALAGSLIGDACTVTNVVVRNTKKSTTASIEAPTVGGLIGNMKGKVEYSAAAVIVKGSETAGGLIGISSGEIIGCYSGGHTDKGEYYNHSGTDRTPIYNVIGTTTAGGLVGSYTGSKIESSYSTCSVSGVTAGGLAGKASGSITNCYATGLVDGSTKYAFIGNNTANLSGNYYYSIINEVPKSGGKEGETELMLPVNGYDLTAEEYRKQIMPLDLNANTYNTFVGNYNDWNTAIVYDPALMQYYGGKYCLRAIDEISTSTPDGFVKTHYGDWPSPEVFFINN